MTDTVVMSRKDIFHWRYFTSIWNKVGEEEEVSSICSTRLCLFLRLLGHILTTQKWLRDFKMDRRESRKVRPTSTWVVQTSLSTAAPLTSEFSGRDTSPAACITVTAVRPAICFPIMVRGAQVKEAFVSSEGPGPVRSTEQPRAPAPFSSTWPIKVASINANPLGRSLGN